MEGLEPALGGKPLRYTGDNGSVRLGPCFRQAIFPSRSLENIRQKGRPGTGQHEGASRQMRECRFEPDKKRSRLLCPIGGESLHVDLFAPRIERSKDRLIRFGCNGFGDGFERRHADKGKLSRQRNSTRGGEPDAKSRESAGAEEGTACRSERQAAVSESTNAIEQASRRCERAVDI